ncbi:MAG: hypothetical protein JNJ84_16165 [Rhodobacteraceae bacterium]|nr:hypothetical protein [Paracoccaceae bacterium]
MRQGDSDATERLVLPEGERHVLRVFALHLPAADLTRLRGNADLLAALLGVEALDPSGVEVFDLADLAGLGLAAYLVEGNGAAEGQIAADRDRLDALTGAVLILHSAAFDGRATRLHPDPRLRLIGTYGEDLPPMRFEPLPDAAARGLLPQGRPVTTDMRRAARITAALLFLAAIALFLLFGR